MQQLNILAIDLAQFDSITLDACAAHGTCNGRGSCATPNSTLPCTCSSGSYYLNDCSASQQEYDSYLQFKYQLYLSLTALKPNIPQSVVQDETLKAINALLSKNDLGLVLSQNDTQSAISDMQDVIAQQYA